MSSLMKNSIYDDVRSLLSPVYLLQSIIIQVFPALVLNDNSIRTVEACSTVLLTTDHQQEVYSFVHLYTIFTYYILHISQLPAANCACEDELVIFMVLVILVECKM